jgi:hypothetical protein
MSGLTWSISDIPELPPGADPGDTWEPGCKWHYFIFSYSPGSEYIPEPDATTIHNTLIANGWEWVQYAGHEIYRKWICPGECHYIP